MHQRIRAKDTSWNRADKAGARGLKPMWEHKEVGLEALMITAIPWIDGVHPARRRGLKRAL